MLAFTIWRWYGDDEGRCCVLAAEDHGAVRVERHPVLGTPVDGSCQREAFVVPAKGCPLVRDGPLPGAVHSAATRTASSVAGTSCTRTRYALRNALRDAPMSTGWPSARSLASRLSKAQLCSGAAAGEPGDFPALRARPCSLPRLTGRSRRSALAPPWRAVRTAGAFPPGASVTLRRARPTGVAADELLGDAWPEVREAVDAYPVQELHRIGPAQEQYVHAV